MSVMKNLRKKIDRIDKNLTRLLNTRAAITLNIGRLKRKLGEGVYSSNREKEVLEKISRLNKGPLTADALKGIYREIMSCSLSLEKPLKVAYLGPEASFTHLAALRRFGSQVKYAPLNSITDVFGDVERGSADYGVVPIENSIEGAVSHTLDMFVDSDLKICAEIILEITHNLLANCPKEKIRRVYSNPQVFGQCRIWLQENLAKAETIEVSSTTRAAQIASGQKSSACIASSLAARA